MKKHLLCWLTALLMTCSKACAVEAKQNGWGAITNNVQVSIAIKDGRKDIKTNLPVRLLIRYGNVSTNEEFFFHATHPIENSPSFSFVVISPSGKDISPSPATEPRSPFGRAFVLLRPGIKELEFNLSKLSKFDEIGSYKIIAKQLLTHGNKSSRKLEAFQVISNPLYVPIVAEGQSTNSPSNPKQ